MNVEELIKELRKLKSGKAPVELALSTDNGAVVRSVRLVTTDKDGRELKHAYVAICNTSPVNLDTLSAMFTPYLDGVQKTLDAPSMARMMTKGAGTTRPVKESGRGVVINRDHIKKKRKYTKRNANFWHKKGGKK